MRIVGFFFVLTWAMLASGAWWWQTQQASSLKLERDRALAACSADQ